MMLEEKTLKETYPFIHAVAATATSKQATTVNPKRRALLVFNNEEANKVELTSDKRTPYGSGIPIEPKACYENLEYCQGAYYLICTTGETADVRIEEDISKE